MRDAGPHVLVTIDNSFFVITDYESLPGRPDHVQRAGPSVRLRQIVSGELFLEKSDEVVMHVQILSKT